MSVYHILNINWLGYPVHLFTIICLHYGASFVQGTLDSSMRSWYVLLNIMHLYCNTLTFIFCFHSFRLNWEICLFQVYFTFFGFGPRGFLRLLFELVNFWNYVFIRRSRELELEITYFVSWNTYSYANDGKRNSSKIRKIPYIDICFSRT